MGGIELGQAELFTYLSAFVTIVLAVAMADMIQSTHLLLRARSRVKWSAPPLGIAVVAAIILVSEFFSLWGQFAVTEITMLRLIWLLLPPAVFALLAYAALPDAVPDEGIDLWQFHLREKGLMCSLYSIGMAFDAIRIWERSDFSGRSIPQIAVVIFLTLAVPLAPAAIIAFTRSPLWQWIGVALLLASAAFSLLLWEIGVDMPG